MNNNHEFMDVDGPEFINEVNHQIAAIRTGAVPSHISSPNDAHGDLRAYYEYYHFGLQEAQTVPEPFEQIAVLDTNFLISNLGYLRDLTQQAAKYMGRLVLVIPWVVVKELDGLKLVNRGQRSKGEHIGNLDDLARKAMRFIEKALRQKAGWLRGQKSYEIYDTNAKLTKGDDSILDCCLFFHETLHKPVTLLTNDRNLAIKAMVHDIRSLSSENKVHLADYMQSISNTHPPLAAVAQTIPQAIGIMEVDDANVYDEDVDMMDEIEDGSSQQHHPAPNPKDNKKSSIWESRHAPENCPANFVPTYQERGSSKHRHYNDDLPVLDKDGEVLKPPSSSKGRTEEQRRKQNQGGRPTSSTIYYGNTIYSSAYAPRSP